MCELTARHGTARQGNGMGAACYVRIGLKHIQSTVRNLDLRLQTPKKKEGNEWQESLKEYVFSLLQERMKHLKTSSCNSRCDE
jgi:hypothetical protein